MGILFVEDDPLLTEALKKYFTKEAKFASNPQEARHILGKDSSYKVVVTDFEMPGETGLSLANFIHTSHPHIHIVLMSGYQSLEQPAPSYIQKFLKKPFSLPDLAETIRAVEKT